MTVTPVVWAVVVCYRPDLAQLARLLDALAPQVAGIVVVDNGPDERLRAALASRADSGVRHLPMAGNVGVASGHNAGIDAVRAQGASHAILFDQDSLPATDMVQRLLAAVQQAQARGLRVASAGPRFHDPRDGTVYPFIRLDGWKIAQVRQPDAGQYCLADYLITSGCLIPLAALDEIGGMEDGLFIDYIDIEWGLRARAHGFVNLGVFDAGMEHDLGDPPRRYFGGRLRVPMHSPLRHYYHFRNALQLYRRGYIPLRWRLNDGYRLLLKGVFYSVMVENRGEQRRMILRGCRDGLAGVAGPYSGAG
ncbi:glycosyltransferase family 2 protein [Cupriavidus sp. AU9028]|uniref:glycosyltransferase family 2 protein n=1 Tax=Cupriavidus sp. AU9028 TaxID=2871157 RepID=UPI001C9841B2|nr:glycosyltransferase family 2 protein [Cupriavidus sp. AU9028]